MTISSQNRVARFLGNGATAQFPFSFKVFVATDITVISTSLLTGLSTTLVLNSDYTIALNADQNANPGGNVVLPAPLALSTSLVLTSNVAYLQGVDITNNGGFYPDVINDEFDLLTILTQQLAAGVAQAIKFPIADIGISTTMPPAITRANKLLGFDAVGQPIVVTGSGGTGTAGVLSFNGRQGTVALLQSDVTALGFTPGGGGTAGVTTFNGRAGAVTLTNADLTAAAGGVVQTPATLPANAVTTFNGRKGAVSLAAGDITAAGGALLAGPAFTGTPTAPTAPTGTISTQVATTAFVSTAVAAGGGGGGGAGNSVLNVAAVRATPIGTFTSLTTRGYYAAGDGGHSTYYPDLSDTSSADNGGSIIVGTDGTRWKLPNTGRVSVLQFGAKGDSTISSPGNDDTSAIQAAINFAQVHGQVVTIPAPRRYRVTNQINITNTVALLGDGYEEIRIDINNPSGSHDWSLSFVAGTIIFADFFTPTAPSIFYVTGPSVIIRDLEFEVTQPVPAAGWAPNATPFAVNFYRAPFFDRGGDGVWMQNIFLRNLTNGINFAGGACRCVIDGLFGQVFGNAVAMTQAFDVMRIMNVHIGYPFWSIDANVEAYQQANAQCFVLGRVDNPNFVNIFALNQRAGFVFYVDPDTTSGQPGRTSRLLGTNIGFDYTTVGFDINDDVDLELSNIYVLCPPGETNSRYFYSHATSGGTSGGYTNTRIQVVNGHFDFAGAEAMRFEVPGVIQLVNTIIANYNGSNGGYPGIAAYSGVNVSYTNLNNTTASSTPLTQTFGTGTISGGGGSGGAVTSVNTRVGDVVINTADIVAANAIVNAGSQSVAGTLRSTSSTPASSGAGVELAYTSGSGSVTAYDRGASTYQPIVIAASTINFALTTGITGLIDPAGHWIFGFSTSQGAYTLQVSGAGYFTGAVYGVTAATSDNSTQFATTAYVKANLAASGVSSFNGRTGAVSLASSDVTSVGGLINSGAQSVSGIIRSTGATLPTSGSGVELAFSSGSGLVTAYNRSSSVFIPLALGGLEIDFSVASGQIAKFDGNGHLLIGYTSSNGSYLLQVNSQIFATSATIATSDLRVKENVQPLGDATAKVLALKPITYTFKPHAVHNFPAGVQVGFGAQDVAAVLADAPYAGSVVTTNYDGAENLMGMAEVKLVPLLVKALQEAFARIETLEKKLNADG